MDSAVHSIIPDQPRERLLVGSKYAITVLDPFRGSSSSFEFPPGVELYTMERNSVGNIDFLMLGSNLGLHTLILENGIPVMDTLTTHELGEAAVIFQFASDSFDPGILIMGKDGVWRTTFSVSEQSLSTSEIIFVESLSSLLMTSATLHVVALWSHVCLRAFLRILFLCTCGIQLCPLNGFLFP